jgi:hypothetical protein
MNLFTLLLVSKRSSIVLDRAQLQFKAAKYRKYVRWVSDPATAQNILGLAADLERQAMQSDEEDIRTRAYDLWMKAGEPENRDEEFWLLAEQELRNEYKSSPLRTPDNL